MTNDEWEFFKKEVKPIKKSGVIKNTFIKKSGEIKKYKKSENLSYIDLEDNSQQTFQIDKNILKRIKRGKINISTSLDLHGFTINESKKSY